MEYFTQNVESIIALGGSQKMNLHIDQIHGINTFVTLNLNADDGTTAIHIQLIDFDSSIEIALEQQFEDLCTGYIKEGRIVDPEKFVWAIREVFKELQFDRFSGKMFYPVALDICSFVERSDISYLEDIFGFEHIKFDFEKCPVCLLNTQTKTKCGHPLCFVCWSNILRTNKICPLCRDKL